MEPRLPRRAHHRRSVAIALRDALVSLGGATFLTVACLAADDMRRAAQVEPGLEFVRWNLFLAWIPLGLAYAVALVAPHRALRPALLPLGLAWLIFLPNAPYLVTDLVHLVDEGSSGPNVVVLSLLAAAGLVIGIRAVQLVHGAVAGIWGDAAGLRVVQLVAVLTAVGIYLGRVLRWNSWTIIEDPSYLVRLVARTPSELEHVALGTVGILAFASVFYASYRMLTGARPRA
jgi:uncharacterized membrane protein